MVFGVFFFFLLTRSKRCFLGELLIREVLFRGDKEARQIELIYQICGTPDELIWPGVKFYSFFDNLGPKVYIPNSLDKYIKGKTKM